MSSHGTIYESAPGWIPVVFRVYFIGLCMLACAAALASLGASSSINETDVIFLAVYVFVFSLLLGIFELEQFKPVPMIQEAYSRNFGFIYKPISKAIFLVFWGCLMLGIKGGALALASAILTLFGAFVLTAVYVKDPALLIKAPKAPEPFRPPPPSSTDNAVRSQEL